MKKVYDEVKKIDPDKVHITPIISNCKFEHHPTGAIGTQTREFIRQQKDNPFCLWVSFPHPHEPYIVPTEYGEMFPTVKLETPPTYGLYLKKQPERMQILEGMLNSAREDPVALKKTMAAYYGNIRFIDDTVGGIVDCLADLDLIENTIIVFCSDHGDFMGELGMTIKGGSFHDSLTRVPLILSGPGIPSGITEDSFVNIIDVVPTLLYLQNIDIPKSMWGKPIPTIGGGEGNEAVFSEYGAGMELMPASILDTGTTEGSSYLSLLKTLQWREAEGRRKMVRTKKWKYIHDPMGDRDELYSLTDDPGELNNCIEDRNLKDIVCSMRLKLLDWAIRLEDPAPVPLPDKTPKT